MDKKVKFEDKIIELEDIIMQLEGENIDLDDSIEKYTKAMKLVQECDKELKNIEANISKIVLENNEIEDFKLDSK